MIYLDEIIESIDILESKNKNDGNIEMNGIAYHSLKVKQGDIFVCIKGYKTDGHLYLGKAAEKGAVAAIVEDFQEDVYIPQYRVKDSRIALAKLADKFYNHPSKHMKMIGITATNGKTTTSFMINDILEKYGLKTGLIGTVVIKNGDEAISSELTTPESLDLQNYLNQMRNNDVTHVSMEVSSSALELHRSESVDFDIVVLNNISREHIDLHKSFDNYFNTKASLIRNAGEDKWAILNLDDSYSASLVNETKAQVLTYGVTNKEGHLCVRDLDLSTGRARFTVEILKTFKVEGIEYKPQKFDVKLSVPGLHSVYNSMAAIAIALLSGIPIDTIQEALKDFKGVERRFEFIFEDKFSVIDDHFANSGNIDVTLGTLDFMEYEDLTLVYAIRGNRGPIVNRENAEAIVKWAPKLGIDEIVATTSQSHVTEKDVVTDEEVAVFEKVVSDAGIKIKFYDELPDAIAHGLSKTKTDDVMLLAGCQGMDFGAQVALKQIHKLRPDIGEEKLFKPLENRVAGIEKKK